MMSWEVIPKAVTHFRLAFPNLLAVRSGGGSAFLGNKKAFEIVPRKIVFLRDGQRLAFREANEDDPQIVVRCVTEAKNGKQFTIARAGIAEPGQRFRIVPDGDLFLLEPLAKEA